MPLVTMGAHAFPCDHSSTNPSNCLRTLIVTSEKPLYQQLKKFTSMLPLFNGLQCRYGGEDVKDILKSKGIRPTQLSQIFERLSLVEPISTLADLDNESTTASKPKKALKTSGKLTASGLEKVESAHKLKAIKVTQH
jgi:hypothetical protein